MVCYSRSMFLKIEDYEVLYRAVRRNYRFDDEKPDGDLHGYFDVD